MRRMIRRVERLEHAIGRVGEEVLPMEITNVFIAPDGEVTDSFVITIPPRLQPMACATRVCQVEPNDAKR